jgi:hypothetical protein
MMTQNAIRAVYFYANPDTASIITPHQLANRFGLTSPASADNEGIYEGSLKSGLAIHVAYHVTHDTLILAITLASQTETTWSTLLENYETISTWLLDSERDHQPWGVSRLFYVYASPGISARDLAELQSGLVNDLNLHSTSGKTETTSFGWLWPIWEGFIAQSTKKQIWQRDMLLVIPDERARKVQDVFIDSFNQGFTRIELYLQKCKHLARQHEMIRGELAKAISLLQGEMLEHLVSSDFSQIHAEPILMEKMSRQLMRFLTQKAAVELLLNSLQTNLTLFQEHLERMKLNAASYQQASTQVTRQIEQIEADLQNASVIQDSVYAVQDIQRGAEASRFERASYLLGYTAALLAGISLFNSFLDIWSLVIENSPFLLPPVGLRITLSLVASIAIPLAATWIIGRKKVPALIASLVSLGTIIAMVIVTLLNHL